LHVGAVQTYLAQKAAAYLSQELQTTIRIDKVKIRLLKNLEVDRLYLEDKEGDTLLYLERLDLDLLSFYKEENELTLNASLDQPIVKLSRSAQDSTLNYQFLIDYFKGDKDTSKSSMVFKSEALSISGGRFSYHDLLKKDSSDRMDYSHMNIQNIDLSAQDIRIDGSFIKGKIDRLSLLTDDGFQLDRLSTNLKIEPELLSFQALTVQTHGTELTADLSFTSDGFKSYKNFIQEVYISANFKNSLLELSDIAYFIPKMHREKHQVLLNGKLKGTVDNLSSDYFELHINKDAYLIGEFDVRGLPKTDETLIFFQADDISFNAEGLRDIPIQTLKQTKRLNIPKAIDRFGDVNFRGNFTGYLNDFVAYGKFTSALGSFGTDILLRQEEGTTFYEGSLSVNDFNLSDLLQNDDLDRVSFNLELDGKGLALDEIVASAKGKIDYLDFKEYRYDQIELNGEFSSKKFNGALSVKDENLKLDFEGKINADTSILASDFQLRVDEARLAKLNLFNQEDSTTNLTFKADINLLGKELDEFDGTFYIDSIHYADMQYNYKTDTVFLKARGEEKGRNIQFHSIFMDANLKGEFKLAQIHQVLFPIN
jgi:hypothetical protein